MKSAVFSFFFFELLVMAEKECETRVQHQCRIYSIETFLEEVCADHTMHSVTVLGV